MTTLMVAAQLIDKLRIGLTTIFPTENVDEVLLYHRLLRSETRLDHYEICLINGGKFVEAVLKCLHYRRTGKEVDTLNVSEEIKLLEADICLNTSERTTIPQTLRIIYEHCSKREETYSFSFDTLRINCTFVVAASNWVLEEFVHLYMANDPLTTRILLDNFLVKDLPFIEEIEGDYLVLKPDLSARVQIELILYIHFPNRCSIEDLTRWIHNHSVNNVRTTLRNMKMKNLAHDTEAGWRLTKAGVRETEAEIAKVQSDMSEVQKMHTTKSRGGKYGRH